MRKYLNENKNEKDIAFEKRKLVIYAQEETYNNIVINAAHYFEKEYDMSLLELDLLLKEHYPERLL
jgi:hypothetical protein